MCTCRGTNKYLHSYTMRHANQECTEKERFSLPTRFFLKTKNPELYGPTSQSEDLTETVQHNNTISVTEQKYKLHR